MESTDEVGAAEEVASKVEAEEDDEEEEEEEEGAEEDMLACPSEKNGGSASFDRVWEKKSKKLQFCRLVKATRAG